MDNEFYNLFLLLSEKQKIEFLMYLRWLHDYEKSKDKE